MQMKTKKEKNVEIAIVEKMGSLMNHMLHRRFHGITKIPNAFKSIAIWFHDASIPMWAFIINNITLNHYLYSETRSILVFTLGPELPQMNHDSNLCSVNN
ncbi:hypothetical protein AMTRI_Chr13g121400 [Amborella trichopoda]